MIIPSNYIVEVFEMLNENDIEYALLTNNGDELPSKLESGKDIDIIIAPHHKCLLEETLTKYGYVRIPHPKGKENGWAFSYSLIESQEWRRQGLPFNLSIDVCFQLMCSSLQPKVWVPLDKIINNDVFVKRKYNEIINCWELDDETRLIYLIVRCVFDKNHFNDKYVEEIKKRADYYHQESFIAKLEKIFFRFTNELIELIEKEKFEEIIGNYITFDKY